MSSVVISGDTSGSITLQAPAVSGATTLILPASAGTSGQVLTSAGSGATMTWGAAGAMTLLATVTASSSSTVSFGSSFITSAYNNYIIKVSNWVPSMNSPSFQIRMTSDNFSTYLPLNGMYTRFEPTNGCSAFSNGNSNIQTAAQWMSLNAADGGLSGCINIYNPSSTTAGKTIDWTLSGFDANVTALNVTWGGTATYRTAATAVNGILFTQSGGTISQGVFKLYGIS